MTTLARESLCTATLTLETVYAREIVKALEPDNLQAPQHLEVTCRAMGDRVECTVKVTGCENPRRLLTLRNTVDEILVLARATIETLERAEGREHL